MGQQEQEEAADRSHRIAEVERHFISEIGRRRRPQFWRDIEVRRFLIAEHNDLTLDDMRKHLAVRFGASRVPGRSAIHRFWQSLDTFWSKRR